MAAKDSESSKPKKIKNAVLPPVSYCQKWCLTIDSSGGLVDV